MAKGHGGYRKPERPAPVSGPGKYSRRTDGQPVVDLPDAEYGANAAFRELQQGAPLAGGGGAPTPAPAGVPIQLTPLGAPTSQPGVPVTNGAEYGPGAGPSALGPDGLDENQQDAKALAAYRQFLIGLAQKENTLPSVKRWVRATLANM